MIDPNLISLSPIIIEYGILSKADFLIFLDIVSFDKSIVALILRDIKNSLISKEYLKPVK